MTNTADKSGRNLIFIISQPRAGSTLLQHVLSSHSMIASAPESWLLLPLIYPMRGELQGEYNGHYAASALKGFLERLPEGEAAYIDAIREAAFYLYERARQESGKPYFLEKTPRYYLIIAELRQLFPQAKLIFLVRNPVAVLSSIVETNLGGSWARLSRSDRQLDVLAAPRLIAAGRSEHKETSATVHYEDFVADPVTSLKSLCRYLAVDFEPSALEYGGKVHFGQTTFVDPKSIYDHSRPTTEYVDAWKSRLNSAKKRYIAREYLEALGHEVVRGLGYEPEDLRRQIDELGSVRRPLLISPNVLFGSASASSSTRRTRIAIAELSAPLRSPKKTWLRARRSPSLAWRYVRNVVTRKVL